MALAPVRPFRVVDRKIEAEGVITLVLAPADGQAMFSFLAGQFVMLHLSEPNGTPWAKAAYSIAGAPVESRDSFELAIKLAGDFTKRVFALQIGDQVGVQGPYGVFTLRPAATRLVLFGGGIGVTPLRSMLREVLLNNDPREVVLFYCDRTRDSLAYEREFRELAAAHSRFRPVFLLTRETPSEWDGEITRLDEAMMEKYLGGFDNANYCMCGPQEFMKMIHETLARRGVDVKTRLQRESF